MNFQSLVSFRGWRRFALGFLFALAVIAALLGGRSLIMQQPALPVPERAALLVIRGVTVLNPGAHLPASQRRMPDRDVWLQGNRILAIQRAGTAAPLQLTVSHLDLSDLRELDGRGRYAIPGLIDMHVHLPPRTAIGNDRLFQLLFLAHGVTGMREMGATDDHVFRVRRRVRAGDLPGTRIFAAGRRLDGPGSVWPIARVLSGPADAATAVNQQIAAGADFIKVYSMLDADRLRAIRSAARDAGLRVVGHVPYRVPFHEAHIADVQHFEDVFQLQHIRSRADWMHASDARWRNVSQADADYVVRVSVEQGLAHTPTLLNSHARRSMQVDSSLPRPAALRYLPAYYEEIVWRDTARPADAASAAKYARRRLQLLRERAATKCGLVRRLHAAGVRIHAGTDILMPYVLPGESMIGEIEALRDCGLDNEAALAAATTLPGVFLNDRLGQIAPGFFADLLLLDADPTQDLAALRNARVAAVADGRLYRQNDLNSWLERYSAHFRGEPYHSVMTWIVRQIVGKYQS